MKEVSLIFPHQLFAEHPSVKQGNDIYLIEEFLFFRQYNFHKQKLVFHRASMKFFEDYLRQKGGRVKYVESASPLSDIRQLIIQLKKEKVTKIHYTDTVDNWLERRIRESAEEAGIQLHRSESIQFLLTSVDLTTYFGKKKKYFQTDFYIQQRKRLNILLDEKEQPLGGKWSLDGENRLRYPKEKRPPLTNFPKPNEFWKEAVGYVKHHFPKNAGNISADFIYPTTFDESHLWLDQFLNTRFSEFGDYEDAIVEKEHILNHGVLTPMLNVGLLTPQEIILKTIETSKKKDIPLNSLEGFIRQIIGWREFIRGVYIFQGTVERTKNFWKFKRKIPGSFWSATTGIAPIDSTIKKISETGYCHHIERLMVLGNFMLLCEFDPNEVYQWFMEMFIDAHDWVMVPNVYGMSQFADGGLMATKPYISGSNYLMKMSDYKKDEWQVTWDALFWRFMHTHRDFFLKNPRLSMLVKTFDKMPVEKQHRHLKTAEAFLNSFDN